MFRKFIPTSLYMRFKGIKYGNNCRFNKTIRFGSEPYLIEIGDDFYSSSNIQFVTHDGGINVIRNLYPDYKDIDIIKPITIGNNVFIGYGCTILPGTIIHDNVIVGANSVVRGELACDSIYAGVPVKRISSLNDFLNKNKAAFMRTKLMSPKEKKKYLMELKLK